MYTITEAINKLAALDTDQIVELLRDKNIKGRKDNTKNCPIAVWMQRITGKDVRVGGQTLWEASVPLTYPHDIHEGTILPHSVRQFVWQFDYGLYTDLDIDQFQG